MKKILALVLAVVMVLGVSVMAGAAAATVSYKPSIATPGLGFTRWHVGNATATNTVNVADDNTFEYLKVNTTYFLASDDLTDMVNALLVGQNIGKNSTFVKYLENPTKYPEHWVDSTTIKNNGVYYEYQAPATGEKYATWEIDDIVDIEKAYSSGEIKFEATINDGADFIKALEFSPYLDELRVKLATIDTNLTGSKNLAFTLKFTSTYDNDVTGSQFVKYLALNQPNKGANDAADDGFDVSKEQYVWQFGGLTGTKEIEFELGDGMTFTVEVNNAQASVNMAKSYAPIDALVDAFPGVQMEFINFKAAPKFNKLGEMVWAYENYDEDEDEIFLYTVRADGKLVEMDCWDEDEDAFVWKTRTLGQYIISFAELDTEYYNGLLAEAAAPAPAENTENPYTGR